MKFITAVVALLAFLVFALALNVLLPAWLLTVALPLSIKDGVALVLAAKIALYAGKAEIKR